jgi:hypothetical protein
MEENPEDEFNNGENGASDNPLNKLGPTVPPVNIDEDGVLISFKPTISGGVIKLKGDVDSETEDKDIGTAPNDIFYTLKQLLTPRVFTVVKEGTISNDVYRVTAIEKLNEKKTDTDLIFTYYDISVEKQQEDGTFVQDQYISPVKDGILDRDKNNFCRLDFTLEKIPPEKTIDSGFIFEANYPEGYPLFYQIGDSEPVSIPSGQQLKVDYDISSIEEDFEPGDPSSPNSSPTNQLEELRVFTTDKSNEFEIKTFKLISQDGEQSATNGSIVVPLIEESLGSIITFQVNVVKKVPPPPTKRKVIISGDVVDELVGFKLSNGREGLVGEERQTFEIEISETQGNYIQFYNPFNISYSDYDLNIIINNGNKKRESNVFETQEEIGENDLNILVVLTKAAKTPPPNQPVIQLRESNIEYNLTQGRDLRIDFSTKNTEEIEYSIGNIIRTIPTESPLILKKEDFQNGFGQYIVRFRPYSKSAGSGEVVSLNINVVEKRFIPGPDIQRIDYPANIQAPDFGGFNVPFDIVLQSINTNYVKIYSQKVSPRNLLVPNASPNGKISLNIEDVLSVGKVVVGDIQDKIELKLFLVPYNTEADDIADGRVEEIGIIFDRGLRIKREDVVKDLREAFQREFDTSVIELESQKFLTHQLHLGDGKNRIISTWATDNLTFDDDSLVLKLYEPLPPEIQTEKQVWISKLQSIPVIDEVEIVDEEVKVCTPLQPNFNIDVVDPIGYEMIDTLIASGSSTSNQLISTYLSSSEFTTDELGIHYITGSGSTEDYNWSDFVKYSSAEERVNNFWYKLRLLESYESDLSNLQTGTEWTGSVDVVNEANRVQGKINTLKGGFDSFEKYLYDTTGSLAYPKTGLTPVASSTSAGQDWYYVTASVSAREYDRNNFDSLVNNIPLHVKNNQNGQEFVLFFSMIGQHFDILWQYTNSVYNMKNLEHKKDIGIANDLVYHMLESFGWEANSSVTSAMLWDYAFGKDKDGNSTATMTGEQRQQEIWRRILNNLPYLLKHKGTKRALHAAMSCYGIPSSLLSIVEFGGPNEPTRSTTTKTTFDDRTAALNFDTNAEIIVPWKVYTSGSYSDYPNSIEARLQTNIKEDQTIFESEGNWSVDIIKTTGSLAYLQMSISSSSDLEVVTSSTFPFFNEEYTQVVINRDFSGSNEVIQLYAKEGFQGRIRNEASSSRIPLTTSNWESGSELKVGGGLSGSMDEFRLWRVALNEQSIENHTLMPDAIDGNSYTASTEDLLFRLDFEYPRNLSVESSSGIPSGSILNVSVRNNYPEFNATASYATASNFPTETSYPYNYTAYDRTVVANVPSIGITFGQKVRFEEQVKISDLSYKSRSTKKSFDQAPIDSDKLGLFFSPVKEINMDILKSLGNFNIDDYIGNPTDRYEDEYKDLKTLRNYYFDRFNLNLYEYIQLVRYIDKTIFTTLESLVPARAKVSKGLLIEPHFLERSKVKWSKPNGSLNNYESVIDVNEDVIVSSDVNNYDTTIVVDEDITLVSEKLDYQTTLDVDTEINLESSYDTYDTSIDTEELIVITSDVNNYDTTISTEDNTILSGEITTNSGSDMGGISISVDAKIEGTISSEYESDSQIQAGMGSDSPSQVGFGLFAKDGVAIRTRYDKNNNLVQDRVKVFQITEQFTQQTPQNISSTDPSLGTENVSVTKTRERVSILPFTGSDGNESPDLTVGGNIVAVTKLDGYFPSHFRYVGDRTTGFQNSFSEGSKQRASTTIDGSSPVESFTTNPNTLRVSDTGRGSGEPILEVD